MTTNWKAFRNSAWKAFRNSSWKAFRNGRDAANAFEMKVVAL